MMRKYRLNMMLIRAILMITFMTATIVIAAPQSNLSGNPVIGAGLQVKNFNCKSVGTSTNQIDWQAVMGTNIKYFAIERSSDGEKFDSIAGIYVMDPSGSDTIADFSYRDDNAQQKLNYYRIKQVSTSGETSFTRVVKVESISNAIDVKIFPNSVAGDVYIHIPGGIKDVNTVDVKVIDMFGKVAFESKVDYYEEVMEVSFELSKGYYNLAVEAGDIQFSKSITIH